MDSTPIYGIIILIFLLLLTTILSYFHSSVQKDISSVNQNANSTISLGKTIYQKCSPGLCVTSKLTGIKRCPTLPTDTLSYLDGIEVCNPEFFCTDKETPYAITSSGEVNEAGECEQGDRCRCINEFRSYYYSATYFEATNGNPYSDSENNYILTQTPIEDAQKNPGKVVFKMPPNTFYKLNPSVLNRLTSGCDFKFGKDKNFLTNEGSNSPDETNMLNCMTEDNNPCIQGQIMYNIDDTNPRNFCSLLSKGIGYLEDPAYYTISCGLGSGCSNPHVSDTSKFYPNFDVQAFGVKYYDVTIPTLYYPVFNTNTYKQECMKCKPIVLTELTFSSGVLTTVVIKYSSDDFVYFQPIFTIYPLSFDIGQEFSLDFTLDGRVKTITPKALTSGDIYITDKERLTLRIKNLISR
jgi:hypothetical protein